jgi:hypothetical protein
MRLYLLDGQLCRAQDAGDDNAAAEDILTPAQLMRHIAGEQAVSLDLVSPLDEVRTLLIAFRGASEARRAVHWDTLCALGNDMQVDLGLPAPAVSISGIDGYGVWLSLAAPVPLADGQRLLRGLKEKYLAALPDAELAFFPGSGPGHDRGDLVELPPCLQGVGDGARWAAFINPGMGASFAGEPGLEMAPPAAAQAAFLAGLDSIATAQLVQALAVLERGEPAQEDGQGQGGVAPDASVTNATRNAATPAPPSSPARDAGLLLKDATLEDIARHLHDRNIEPTFRHLMPR